MKPADRANLVYVSDALPGITRHRQGKGFIYRDASGERLRDAATLRRIGQLAIPPAYTSVWICPLPDGHLQATGRDARGRKQYRYHPAWRRDRDERKYERLAAFGRALSRIRARVSRDLADGGAGTPTRELVLATMVRLLDTTCIRVGSARYARHNRSYGLTTLRSRHVQVSRASLRLNFTGKGGIRHEVALDDPCIARIVRRLQHLPGQELFQYLDDDGLRHAIGSSELNDYLERIAGERFTAKDFRTWHGTVTAHEWTREAFAGAARRGGGRINGGHSDGSKAAGRSNGASASSDSASAYSVTRMLTEVARRLGNTPAVCRNAYIHPDVLGLGARLAEDTEACKRLAAASVAATRYGPRHLHAAERRLLMFLEGSEIGNESKAQRERREDEKFTLTGKPLFSGTSIARAA